MAPFSTDTARTGRIRVFSEVAGVHVGNYISTKQHETGAMLTTDSVHDALQVRITSLVSGYALEALGASGAYHWLGGSKKRDLDFGFKSYEWVNVTLTSAPETSPMASTSSTSQHTSGPTLAGFWDVSLDGTLHAHWPYKDVIFSLVPTVETSTQRLYLAGSYEGYFNGYYPGSAASVSPRVVSPFIFNQWRTIGSDTAT